MEKYKNFRLNEKGECVVSCSFLGIRDDRPDDYYIKQLNDFIAVCNHQLIVFTNHNQISPGENITLVQADPALWLKEVWADDNWENIYHETILNNPTHRYSPQAYNRRLIAVYLSKMAMIRHLTKFFDKIAWVDAGLIASYVYDHDFSKYNNLYDPEKIENLFNVFETDKNLVCCFDTEPLTFHMPLSIIKNYAAKIKENPDLKYITAAVMFYSRENFNGLFYDFKKFWMQHIQDGHAGIEENALTLMALKNDIRTEKITDILKEYFIAT